MVDNLFTLKDLETAAKQNLSPPMFNYICDGSMYGETLQENYEAFKRYKIKPRFLKNVSSRELDSCILGNKIAIPIGLSPVAFQKISHPEGEIATGRAAMKFPTVMVLSTWANVSVEDIMSACPSLICFQHLPITKPRKYTIDIVKKAERASVKGFVVTVDHPVRDKMLVPMKNLPDNYARWGNSTLQTLFDGGVKKYDEIVYPASNTWDDISWLKSLTTLPVILKGIQTVEDTVLALKYGADAIWVSNHGGRRLDSTRATVDILPEIVETVNEKCEVYVDGGFRTGLDIFKGLALGATAVFIGRPIHYGLACGGEVGVTRVLDILQDELDYTMALSGCSNISDISNVSLHRNSTCKL